MRGWRIAFALLIWTGCIFPFPDAARAGAPSLVTGLRSWTHPDFTRIVVDLTAPVGYRVTTSDRRLEVELSRAQLAAAPAKRTRQPADGLVRSAVLATDGDGRVHVVVILETDAAHHLMKLAGPPRLVIDISRAKGEQYKRPDGSRAGSGTGREASENRTVPAPPLIVLDPGHGGRDPGAVGPSGLAEKDVVLDIALRLRKMLEKRLGYRVLLTRGDDRFVPLEERARIANGQAADLFVSIHANASPRADVRGSEMYLLGPSSDPRAEETAARENFEPGRSGEETQRVVDLLLKDLSRMKRMDDSLTFAHTLQRSFVSDLSAPYGVTDLGVKRAPFYVLINAEMPSVLAEVGFITNPREEARLAQKSYRRAAAEALFKGIRRYLVNESPL